MNVNGDGKASTPATSIRLRWLQFSIGMMLVVITLVALFLGWRVNRRDPVRDAPFTPADINALVAHITGPPKVVGFINNVQVPAANRLGEISPQQAKQNDVVPALESLIANTSDPEAKKAAEQALSRIRGW